MLGVVNLDKPVGPTSHDMVGLLRRLTGTRRVGHAGTLDPLASGVLPILVGAVVATEDGSGVENTGIVWDPVTGPGDTYVKQHPVPFGEYIPWRPVFEWIPALDRVPRDMIPGDGPVVFDGGVGSVISFEGGFSRYAFETRRAGANVIVVNTNNASYGLTPASDIWMGMTRMRAVELGVPVVHAAVTGTPGDAAEDVSLRRVLRLFPTHYPHFLLEQAAISGAFVPGQIDADIQGTADAVAARIVGEVLQFRRLARPRRRTIRYGQQPIAYETRPWRCRHSCSWPMAVGVLWRGLAGCG